MICKEGARNVRLLSLTCSPREEGTLQTLGPPWKIWGSRVAGPKRVAIERVPQKTGTGVRKNEHGTFRQQLDAGK